MRRDLLLRVANVDPAGVTTHSDRVLYRAIGVFLLLYAGYATVGAAAFVDAGSGGTHPWWRWLVGPLVALGVVAYDRAVVGRVAVGFERLDSPDPAHLLRPRTPGLYAGRLALALLCAVLVTEPLMLTRYAPEIDARLAAVHDARVAAAERGGTVAAYDARLAALRAVTAAEDRAVAAVTADAARRRADARALYDRAVADSAGTGASRRRGCPPGGFCATLVRRSRALEDRAAALDAQAVRMRAEQRVTRTARSAEEAGLVAAIAARRAANATAIDGDAGFGARTAAMWHLVTADFWGVGVWYLGVALLLLCLDCAAVALKFASHGNAYERGQARAARRLERQAAAATERELDAGRLFDAAAVRVLTEAVDAAGREEYLAALAAERARAGLAARVAGALAPPGAPAARPVPDGAAARPVPDGAAARPAPDRPAAATHRTDAGRVVRRRGAGRRTRWADWSA